MTTKSVLFGMSLFLALSHYGVCLTDTWYVNAGASGPRDGRSPETGFQRIQQGIDAASNGDTVIVAEGTYVENIQFKGKNIVLTSKDPLDSEVVAKTIIDGNQAGSVVTFSGTEDETCVLSGFTIRNGNSDRGGGIRGWTGDAKARVTVHHNRIVGNRARWGGGVFWCDGPIHDNTIEENGASEEGGGLSGCDGVVENNVITANSAGNPEGGWPPALGGGLAHCGGVVRNNTISDNSGSALYACGGTIEGNVVSGNSGRGVDYCEGTILNNTISRNAGGGLSFCHGTIQNNTIAGNAADHGGALDNCNATITNCIIWGNGGGGLQIYSSSTPSYSCIEGWVGGGTGNIPFEPFFVDAENGDYCLQPWSPCMDAGDPGSDFSNEPEPNGGRVNIGAHGNTPEAATKSPDSDGDDLPDDWEMKWFQSLDEDGGDDADGDGIPNMREYRYGHDPTVLAEKLVERVREAKRYQTIQSALIESVDTDEIVVPPGTYVENIAFGGKNVVLRSTDPSDTSVVASTIIDGGGRGPVVVFSGTEDQRCVLSGFTIQNGSDYRGGGICGGTVEDPTHATIQNNRIIGNSASFGGGLAFCYGIIRNNVIAWNTGWDGGGLFWCYGDIVNNTVFGNSASSGSGALNCSGEIRNCIFWGNTLGGNGQIYLSSMPTHCCIEQWLGGGEGNIVYSPYFVDAANGDLHLMSRSPCIDAGDPSSAYSNEPDPNGGRINIGAYGNTPEAASRSPDTDADGLPDDWELEFFGSLEENPTADPDGDLISNILEYQGGTIPCVMSWYVDVSIATSGDGRTWQAAFKTIQEAIDAADSRDTITVAEGVYFENIHFNGKNVILRGGDFAERGAVGGTIIDGNQANRVVTFSGTENETCVLEGLVIRNGKTDGRGGGICGWGPDLPGYATIRNNIIIGNCADDGGAIAYCAGIIENNTIYGNSAKGAGALLDCPGTIRNCIIWGNSGTEKAQVAGDTHPTYSCIEDWRHGGEGNVTYHPYFADAANRDFHLRSWSPCIDAGDPASVFSREPEPNGARVNMGVYGNTAEAASRSADSDEDGLPDDWEMEHFGDLARDAAADPDGDLISNVEEYRRGYDPAVPPAAWYVDRAVTASGNGTSWESAFKTIQESIDATSDGNSVIVAKGVYRENINFRGKSIKLTSTDPLTPSVVAETIIDGMKSGSVVSFGGGEDEGCLLAGFTIRNGEAESGGGINGGPWTQHTLAKIQYNIIWGNVSDWVGGGICTCDGAIEYNIVSGNLASRGGGVSGCNGDIRHNTITGNSAREYGGGFHNCIGTIQHNTISGNSASQGGGLAGCDGVLENNAISYNWGSGFRGCGGVIRNNAIYRNSGGGLRECSGAVVNCMIYGNYGTNLGGGLLYCWGPILNCNIVGNRAYMSGGGLYSCAGAITNCVIWGNSAPDAAQFDLELTSPPTYSCIEGLTELSDGNINSDPLFTNPAKYDYHLLAGSPCTDAGTNEVLDSLQTDIDGEERPFGLRVDIGADEYVDSDGDDLADRWETTYLGSLGFGPSDDPDADGLTNRQELQLSTDPNNDDTDADGLTDSEEVYAYGTDPTSDDTDGDGLKDDDEIMGYGTDPNSPDSDADGMPDGWEKKHGLHPMKKDADDDPDRDGLTNLDEYFNETNPQRDDTEGDGMPDGWEVEHGLDPRMDDAEDDPDDDGLANLSEYQHTTDPNDDDTDGDTLPDGWEVEHNLDPLVPGRNDDPDGDGLSNLSEYLKLTDPLDADTDDDTMDDGDEVFAGTDPLDPESLFRILAAEGVGTGLRLEWSVVTGRQYQVYKSADLTTWNPYLSPMTSSPGETSLSVLDPKALGQRRLFLRVEILP